MNWTRYKLTILLCAAVVAWGVSCSIAEFNYRVRPETPLYAFKLEARRHSSYHVDFLGESISFALPPDQVRQFADSKQIKRYREHAAIILDIVSQGIEAFLAEAQIKLNKGSNDQQNVSREPSETTEKVTFLKLTGPENCR